MFAISYSLFSGVVISSMCKQIWLLLTCTGERKWICTNMLLPIRMGQIRMYHICPRFTPQFLHFWDIFTMRKFVQINKSAISMVCFLVDHRNDVKLFKTKVEPRVAGEWFHCNVWSVLTSFLWSIKSTDHRKLLSICFYMNIKSFWRPFPLTFLEKIAWARKKKPIAPPSLQRARNRSVILKSSFFRTVLMVMVGPLWILWKNVH